MIDRLLAIAEDLDEAARVFVDYDEHGYAMAHLHALRRALRSQADDTATRFGVQHALIMERRDASDILEARIADEAEARLDDQGEMRSVYNLVLNRLDAAEARIAEHSRLLDEARTLTRHLSGRLEDAERRLDTTAGRFYAGNGGY